MVNYIFSEAIGNSEIWGRHVETAIGVHLLTTTKTENLKLSYWRDGNYEVDYILEYKNKVIALEVKSGKAKYTSGMNRFKSQFNPF
ncbi:MAG: DUF4143 domain-containing protein [Draconibacterium sp.]|nr:DUF4143 domain-containing protein [Draconibacterium sp.]